MFWKSKKNDGKQDSKIILGMIMLNDKNTFKFDDFVLDYNNNYNAKIEEPTRDNLSAAFTINGETVAIGHIPAPIPSGDIEATAQYSYNWQTVLKDTKEHKSHLIVSVMGGSQDPVKRFKIFTRVICSLLRTTNAAGVYKGNQSLLIPKDDYLSEAKFMSDEYLPVNLWIYFGLRVSDNGNSGYTYGLKEFNKTEMEILNSSNSLENIREFLLSISRYVLENNVEFKDGQTCGFSESEKIRITYSKGNLIEGKTFKLAY
ncbi:MAG: DUF4261 domain-containing protein [Bacteroidota bacterium]|nr:DUF4261 domain-containing protein [Bacteroidota bacterium]